ncbi:MAG: flagellin [Smithellaceae bacterium]
MSSITLTSSISQNLSSLQATQSLMDDTSYRLTTGKKVNSALDDPINFFAAQDHTQKANDLQVLKDGMSEGIETINSASTGIDSISDLIDTAKSLAKSALSADTSAEAAAYVTQYNAILDEIDATAEDSVYSGINLLGSDKLEITVGSKADSKITVSGIDASSSGLAITEASSWWDTSSGAADSVAINADLTKLDTAKSTLRSSAKNLSSQLSIVTNRQDFTTSMISTLNEGAATLVNADTTEEGVNLTTLQTQQSLGIQALSIAKSASQAVLNLFA